VSNVSATVTAMTETVTCGTRGHDEDCLCDIPVGAPLDPARMVLPESLVEYLSDYEDCIPEDLAHWWEAEAERVEVKAMLRNMPPGFGQPSGDHGTPSTIDYDKVAKVAACLRDPSMSYKRAEEELGIPNGTITYYRKFLPCNWERRGDCGPELRAEALRLADEGNTYRQVAEIIHERHGVRIKPDTLKVWKQRAKHQAAA
jgi:hypothetical protein